MFHLRPRCTLLMCRVVSSGAPLGLRVQALEIVQNLTADSLPSEVGRYLELLGEGEFLTVWVDAAREGQDTRLRVPVSLSERRALPISMLNRKALYVMSNLALGNEKVRNIIASHVEILEVLSEALVGLHDDVFGSRQNAKVDQVKVPAIRSLRHLLESNAKTHRPRQGMLDLLQPYQLKSRLKDLAESSPSLDVCHGAVGLLEVLDRGRESGTVVGSVPK